MFLAFAAHEFSKIYFPYGLILQRANPVSWPRYFRQRVPIISFFVYVWYISREAPRAMRYNYADPTEK